MSFWTTGAVRVKVAGAVVAAISLGGFAVAAASVAKEPTPTLHASDVTTPTDTSGTTTPTDPPVTEPITVPTDPPAVATPCTNHGAAVSQVAHQTEPGEGHGAAVSAAAHNHDGECKHHDDEAEADDQETNDQEADDQEADDDDAPATADTSAPAPSEDHGRGGGHGSDD